MGLNVFSQLLGGSESESSGRSFVDPRQQPFLDILRNQALGFLNAGRPEFFNQALSQFSGSALNNPLLNAASADIMNTLSGGLPPGFNQQMQAVSDQIQPVVDSRFAKSGRFGSGLHKTALQKELANAGAGLISQERGRALSAIPGINQAQQGGLMALLNFDPRFQQLQRFGSLIGSPTVLSENQSSSAGSGGGLLDLIAGGMFLGGAGPFG